MFNVLVVISVLRIVAIVVGEAITVMRLVTRMMSIWSVKVQCVRCPNSIIRNLHIVRFGSHMIASPCKDVYTILRSKIKFFSHDNKTFILYQIF